MERDAGRLSTIPIRCVDPSPWGGEDLNALDDVCARAYVWTAAPHTPEPGVAALLWMGQVLGGRVGGEGK